jgi:transposase
MSVNIHQHLKQHLPLFNDPLLLLYTYKGYDANYISKHIPCNIHTVYHWINHYRTENNVENKNKSGRKRKLLNEITNQVVQNAKEVISTTPKKIKHELEIKNISARTIRRTLNEHNIHGHIAKTEYPFNELQIKKRLSFATGYSHRDDWSDVLFSDEKTFPLMHTTSKQYVQIPDGDNPYIQNTLYQNNLILKNLFICGHVLLLMVLVNLNYFNKILMLNY